MSIATELTNLAANRDAIKAAIEAKNPSVAPTNALSSFPAAIAAIPSGGGGDDEPKPWYGSGTHIWMHFEESYASHIFYFGINMLVSGTATIDWGDGNVESVSSSPSEQTITRSHTYADGDYTAHITGYDECQIVRLTADGYASRATLNDFFTQIESDTTKLAGNGNGGYAPMPSCRKLRHINLTRCATISNVGIGAQKNLVTLLTPKVATISTPWSDGSAFYVHSLDFPMLSSISGTPFRGLRVCESIKIGSAGLTTMPNNSLRDCARLGSIVLPTSLTSLGDNFLYGSFMFGGSIKIQEGITSFSGEALRSVLATEIDLPSSFSSFGSSVWAMNGVYCLERLIVRATTPPTLPSTNNLSSLQSFCKIYVPYGCGETYKAATNWSAQAGKIYELNQDGTIPQA